MAVLAHKQTFLAALMLIALGAGVLGLCALQRGAFLRVSIFHPPEKTEAVKTETVKTEVEKTGVAAYIHTCSTPAENPACHRFSTIRKEFGFDLLAEIETTHRKMRRTARDIAHHRLTGNAYAACLQNGHCARVPMLPKGANPALPENRQISKVFWQLVDDRHLTPDICAEIPLCLVALQNGAVAFANGKFTLPSPRKTTPIRMNP